MLYRVCFLFLLFLVGVFYWRCAGDNKKGGAASASLSAQCVNNRAPARVNEEFSDPVKVTIKGYEGHAMDPFISRDGNYLFFNSQSEGEDTCLYYAGRINDATFNFLGKIEGANGKAPHFDAVPSMDSEGRFYFISTRNYYRDHNNVYSGHFLDGRVYDLDSQPGNFYATTPGSIVMDAEISPDGEILYYTNACYSGGKVPDRSEIGIARMLYGNFNADRNSAKILKNINTADSLEYAPSISTDGLDLFFTRLDPCVGTAQLFIAKRRSISEPFRTPERIGAVEGFAEAPSISHDKKTLYYHSKDDNVYAIYKVSR
jgi:Tol biopolymer transport system component